MAAKVYVNGRVRPNVRAGRKAGEFGKENSQYVVSNRSGTKTVSASYALKTGDTLIVTNRGVGG